MHKEACEIEQLLMEDSDILEQKMIAIKYEIKNIRERGEDLNEMMELRQNKINQYLEWKAEVQQTEYEEFVEWENDFRRQQARKYWSASENVNIMINGKII